MADADPLGPAHGPEPDSVPDGGDAYELRFDDERPQRSRLDTWRKTTATGAIVGAVTIGLQQVFDPEKKATIAIEQEAPDEPVDPARVELDFDPMNSRGTSVTIHLPPDPE